MPVLPTGMTFCPTCANPVAVNAFACPQCGAPISPPKQHGVFYYVLWGLVSLLVILFLASLVPFFVGALLLGIEQASQPPKKPAAVTQSLEEMEKVIRLQEKRRSERETADAAEQKDQQEAFAKQDEKPQEQRTSGVESNIVEFLKARAWQGSAEAQYGLAIRYLEGRGVEKNVAEAKRLLIAAATQGHTKAAEALKDVLASEAKK